MKGIEYVVDDSGERRAVLIDLGLHAALWEDFYDAVLTASRKDEPRESLDEVRRHLSGSGA